MKRRYWFPPIFGVLCALLDLCWYRPLVETVGFGPIGLYGTVAIICFLYWKESR